MRNISIFCVSSFIFSLIALFSNHSLAYKAEDFVWMPPLLSSQEEKPSTTIILDNSGSMLERAYTENFNASKEYYGYFDPRSYYSYSTSNEHFYLDNSSGSWNGNFLNWATMHRIDVAKKILIGGKYISNRYETEPTDSNWRVPEFTYNDSSTTIDLNGNARYMTPYHSNLTIDHESGTNNIIIKYGNQTRTRRARLYSTEAKTGVLHQFKNSMRIALFFYNTNQGAKVSEYMGSGDAHFENVYNAIRDVYPSTWTPLAEALYTVTGYIKQDTTQSDNGPRYSGTSSYTTGTTYDPYYFSEYSKKTHCTKQSIILITDGESTQDKNIPSSIKNIVNPKPHSYSFSSDGTSYLIDVAYYGHTTDLRSDFPGQQSFDFYTVFAFGSGSNLLKDAARYGNFKDSNGNNLPDLAAEYDTDGNGLPDAYFEAETGQELEAAITTALQMASTPTASGTAAAMGRTSSSTTMYSAIFYPPTNGTMTTPPWAGDILTYFLDSSGQLREDSNANFILDSTDKNITFEVNSSIITRNGVQIDLEDINFVWRASTWLNNIPDSSVVTQRSLYNSTAQNRYIITFADADNDGIADSGEIQNFELLSNPSDTTDTSKFYSYLTLYPSFDDAPTAITSLSTSSKSSLLGELARRQVEFIRGKDQGNFTVSGYTLATRSRSYTQNGTTKTWRLGDIIYSTPAVVNKPNSFYHQLYQDSTYLDFYKKYKNRREVIYVGANDGMLHAFNGGFFSNKQILTSKSGEASFAIGQELWAYVPYHLLPHLYWLMHQDYGPDIHSAYMDLSPIAFDARVFPDSTTHPNGWGTLLVAGMRFGGATVHADVNKNDSLDSSDRLMRSAYVVMDITDPEQPPTPIAEITAPGLGFTTCMPAFVPVASASNASQWFLVFGSGPADSAGTPAATRLTIPTSDQNGKLFVVDLNALVQNKELRFLNASGQFTTTPTHYATTEAASFITDPWPVDLDLAQGQIDFPGAINMDVVYYGTVAGDQTNATGTVRRLLTKDTNDTSQWIGNATLISLDQPVASGFETSIDTSKRPWVYFGTGRYFHKDDILQKKYMSFYGVREPADVNGTLTWGAVNKNTLYNSTAVTIDNTTNDASFQTIISSAENASGWRLDFSHALERVVNKPLISEGIIYFTSYIPNYQITDCAVEGNVRLYGVYYKTGTAYIYPVFDGNSYNTFIDIGKGLPVEPKKFTTDTGAKIFVGPVGINIYSQSNKNPVMYWDNTREYDLPTRESEFTN